MIPSQRFLIAITLLNGAFALVSLAQLPHADGVKVTRDGRLKAQWP